MPDATERGEAGALDALSKLEAMVEQAGSVASVYGGFEITVYEPDAFPWTRVLELLTDLRQDVWIEKIENYIVIKTKPPAT